MLGPATQQHKSATIIHLSCSSLASPPPPHPSRLSQSVRRGPLCNTATSHPVWDGYLMPESLYMLTLLSQPSHSLPPHCAHKSILYVCVSIPSLQIGSSIAFFWIPYIYTLTYCICFSLSALLHSVDPSTSPELTQTLWPNCTYVLHLYPIICCRTSVYYT